MIRKKIVVLILSLVINLICPLPTLAIDDTLIQNNDSSATYEKKLLVAGGITVYYIYKKYGNKLFLKPKLSPMSNNKNPNDSLPYSTTYRDNFRRTMTILFLSYLSLSRSWMKNLNCQKGTSLYVKILGKICSKSELSIWRFDLTMTKILYVAIAI